MTISSRGIVLPRVGDASIAAAGRRRVSRVLEWFVAAEFMFQVALLVPSLSGTRVVFRCAAFGTSLGLLFLLTPGKRLHPAAKPCLAGVGLVALAILHPSTNTALAGAMHFLLYLAIAAPLLWVSNLELDQTEIRRVLLIMLVFQTTSSIVGILQVYFPGHLRGAMSTVITGQNRAYLRGLTYVNAAGNLVFRPSGLTDVPGGVSGAGQITTLLSLYFVLTERGRGIRLFGLLAAVIGVAAVYLSGIKSAMILEALCLVVFVTLFFWRNLTGRRLSASSRTERRRVSAIQVLLLTAIVAAGGYFLALSIGGSGVTTATQALRQGTPSQVYYRERGKFLEYTVTTLLPEYPFGAGLGRWGMMSYYFGNPRNPDSPPIWVEIQWTGWLLDGGVPLILVYPLAIFIATLLATRCAIGSGGNLAILGALIASYDVGVAATTFNSVPFIGGTGMDFWVLNAMLFCALLRIHRSAKPDAWSE